MCIAAFYEAKWRTATENVLHRQIAAEKRRG
jgi:hypothetical protein